MGGEPVRLNDVSHIHHWRSIPAWAGEPISAHDYTRDTASGSIPAWAGEPLFRQYQQGWNIAEANYRHFSKLVVRWLMIFDQVYSVRIHNLLRRLAQGADLLLAHGRKGHARSSLSIPGPAGSTTLPERSISAPLSLWSCWARCTLPGLFPASLTPGIPGTELRH